MSKKMLSAPYIFWMIGFTLLPLVTIVYYGITTSEKTFTFDNLTAITQKIHLEALWLSLLLAVICTAVCLLLAYPLALILNNLNINKNSFVIFIFVLPMWMNFMLRTLALRTMLSPNGILNTALEFLHLPKLNILYTPYAIIIGMIYHYLPFMVLPLYNAVSRVDRGVLEAARDLGANSTTIFRRILLPLTLPGIVSGITMVFIPAISEFVISSILGGNKILLIGNIIEQEFTYASNRNLGSGLSLVLMAFILISMAFMNKYDKNGGDASVW